MLTATSGTETAHITLIGNYASSTFATSSDGHNGTLITPGVLAMIQAAASFAAPAAAATPPISRTTSSAETPFLHATGSAWAGHL